MNLRQDSCQPKMRWLRAPILEGGLRTVTFKTDNMKVWGLISAITRDFDCWTYVKLDQRTRDGRKAYRDLWVNFLGPDNSDNMASEAVSLLITTHSSGECKWLNFERCVKIKKDKHHIIEGLKEHGHVGINIRSQVRNLIQGIKITELDTVKAQIMATTFLRTYYNECISLYKTFINKSKNVSPPELNISGVESSDHRGGGQKKRKGDSGGAFEDVYYSNKEYKVLCSEQKSALYKDRQARGHKPPEKKVKYKWSGETDKLEKQVSALVAVMASELETPGTPPTHN